MNEQLLTCGDCAYYKPKARKRNLWGYCHWGGTPTVHFPEEEACKPYIEFLQLIEERQERIRAQEREFHAIQKS